MWRLRSESIEHTSDMCVSVCLRCSPARRQSVARRALRSSCGVAPRGGVRVRRGGPHKARAGSPRGGPTKAREGRQRRKGRLGVGENTHKRVWTQRARAHAKPKVRSTGRRGCVVAACGGKSKVRQSLMPDRPLCLGCRRRHMFRRTSLRGFPCLTSACGRRRRPLFLTTSPAASPET